MYSIFCIILFHCDVPHQIVHFGSVVNTIFIYFISWKLHTDNSDAWLRFTASLYSPDDDPNCAERFSYV